MNTIAKDHFGEKLVIGDLVAVVGTGQSPNMEVGIVDGYHKTRHKVKVRHISRHARYQNGTFRQSCKLLKIPYSALPKSIQNDLSLEELMKVIKSVKEQNNHTISDK
jgi:hypothetical protein